MKELFRLLDPSDHTTYLVGILTEPDEKNQAYALLYRQYILKAGWKFGQDRNPSEIRVEHRRISSRIGSSSAAAADGKDESKTTAVGEKFIDDDDTCICPVLVDKYEPVAVVGGMILEKERVLVGTCRLLLRSQVAAVDMADDPEAHRDSSGSMNDGLLEIETFQDAMPEDLRKKLIEIKPVAELNRWAIDDRIQKKHSGMIVCAALMEALITHPESDRCVWAVSEALFSYHRVEKQNLLGTFRYERQDPHPVAVATTTPRETWQLAWLHATRAGIIPLFSSKL